MPALALVCLQIARNRVEFSQVPLPTRATNLPGVWYTEGERLSTDSPHRLSNVMSGNIDTGLRMTAADEQHLIREARAGNGTAFRHLVERHMKQTYNVAFGLLGDHQGAEDVAQETFIRVFTSLHTFRGDAEFTTWLYRITVNLALNRRKQERRKSEREATLSASSALLAGDGHETFATVDQPAHIERALHELPTLQRSVIILRHMNGLSTKQVSSILGCSEGTVKTHLHRALKKLRSRLHYLVEDAPR